MATRGSIPRQEVIGDVAFYRDGPIVNTSSGPSGMRVQLGRPDLGVTSNQLLGPLVEYAFQPQLVGLEFRIANASGNLTVRAFDPNGDEVWSSTQRLGGRNEVLGFRFDPILTLGGFEWTVDSGYANVTRVELLTHGPYFDSAPPLEDAFLFTYGQLSRCWDADRGLAAAVCSDGEGPGHGPRRHRPVCPRDRWWPPIWATSPATMRGWWWKPRAMGCWPCPADPEAGLLPEQADLSGATPALAEGSYWSSLGTVLGVSATILAAESEGLATTQLEGLLEDIAWDELTINGGQPIGAGFDASGQELDWRYGAFGSKSFLLQVAHHAATGEVAPMDLPYTPTWDGAGWDNELANLLFPMQGFDYVGNDWTEWRKGGLWQHHAWGADTEAGARGLWGLSSSEIPEPWAADANTPTYGDWGVGGHNQRPADGAGAVGYTFFAPHYPALVAGDEPGVAEPVFQFLLDNGLLSPLNAVESIGVDDGLIRFNHHHRGFTLALQALGLSRALSTERLFAPPGAGNPAVPRFGRSSGIARR